MNGKLDKNNKMWNYYNTNSATNKKVETIFVQYLAYFYFIK
jgi:hypothetical protein